MVSYSGLSKVNAKSLESLNPYCSGRWSRTANTLSECMILHKVLILIVVDDGLVRFEEYQFEKGPCCLNPYCSGRWSRTADKFIGKLI